ncbi:MAG TPA: hypothetical protein VFE37_11395 [Chloroflexota bacterium]|nr:hypothetical protein [Chloroflexota bacterium]
MKIEKSGKSRGGTAQEGARTPTPQRAALSARSASPPSAKRLRALLRTSPLIAPELRAHWLRVLPHLSAGQRAELAALLEVGSPAESGPGPADVDRA